MTCFNFQGTIPRRGKIVRLMKPSNAAADYGFLRPDRHYSNHFLSNIENPHFAGARKLACCGICVPSEAYRKAPATRPNGNKGRVGCPIRLRAGRSADLVNLGTPSSTAEKKKPRGIARNRWGLLDFFGRRSGSLFQSLEVETRAMVFEKKAERKGVGKGLRHVMYMYMVTGFIMASTKTTAGPPEFTVPE